MPVVRPSTIVDGRILSALQSCEPTRGAVLPSVVRHILGPAWQRLCLGLQNRLIWIEASRGRSPAPCIEFLSEFGAYCRDHDIADVRNLTAAPQLSARGVYLYRGMPGSALLADPLIERSLSPRGGGGGPVWPNLPSVCRRLGRYLRRIHELRMPSSVTRLLAREPIGLATVRKFLASAPSRKDRRAKAARRLRDEVRRHPSLLVAVRRACAGAARPRRRALVHGDFSLGNVLVGGHRADKLRVIGWLHAARSIPAYDVGYFMGELLEFYFIAKRAGDRCAAELAMAAQAFMKGYLEGFAPQQRQRFWRVVRDFAVTRQLHHLILYARHYGLPAPSAGDALYAAIETCSLDGIV